MPNIGSSDLSSNQINDFIEHGYLKLLGMSASMRIAAFERRSQTCRDHTLRGPHPLQPIKHLARHGDEQVLAKAIAQHLPDVLDHVSWEVWRALVRPTALLPAVIGPHWLLSVAVHRPLC